MPGEDQQGDARPQSARSEKLLLLALVGSVAFPVLAAGVRMVAEGWQPTFDDAVVTHRAYDVFSRHSPLVGQFSLAGSTGPSTHSPGPMLFWWLAVPARIGATWAMPLWAAATNACCFSAVVVLARRRGGLGLAAVVAVGCLVLLRALGPATMAEVWNPWIGLAPLLLLTFLTWSIIDGEPGLLPVAVLVGSFTMQGHLSVLFPSVALLGVAFLGGWIWPVVNRREDVAWRPLVIGVLVGLACWALPFYEDLTRDPGNLTLLARSSGEEGGRGGLSTVRAALWHSLGVPPIWLRGEQDPLTFATRSFARVGWAHAVNLLAVVGLGVWLCRLARRLGDRRLLAGLSAAGALVVGMIATAFAIPLDRALVAGYTFRWFVIGSAFCWLVLGIGVARYWLVPAWRARAGAGPAAPVDHPSEGDRPGRAERWLVGRVPLIAAIAGVAAMAALLLPWKDQFAFSYVPADRLAALAVDNTEPGGTYLVAQSGQWDLGFTPVVAWALRTNGRHPVVAGTRIEALGEQYAPQGRRCDGRFVLQGPDDPRDPAVTYLDDFPVADSGYLPDRMVVGIVADTSPDGLC